MADTSVVKVGAATFGSEGLTLIADLGMAVTPEPAVAAVRAGASVVTGRHMGALTAARVQTGRPVIAYVTDPREAGLVAEHADMLRVEGCDVQLLDAAGRAGRPVLLQRGAHATVHDWLSAAERLAAVNAPGVVLCERGGAARTGPDIGMVPFLRRRSALPVVVDPGRGRDLMLPLSLAAIGGGADGLIVDADTAAADLRTLTDTASQLAPRRDARTGVPSDALDLAELRDRLDTLDEQIIRLIADRRDIATVIGRIKARDRRPVRDLRRETQVLDQVTALAERLHVPSGTVNTIFSQLIADAVAVQSVTCAPAVRERAHPSDPLAE